MAISYNPSIVRSGLVLCLDAGNQKGFDSDENLQRYSNSLTTAASPLGYGGGYSQGWMQNSGDITQLSDEFGIYYNTTYNLVWSAYGTCNTSGSTVYTVSFFAKSSTVANIRPRLYSNVNGTVSTGTYVSLQTGGTSYPGGWRKFEFTMPSTTNTGNSLIIELSTGSGFDIKNIQVETGSTASSYYETTTTAKIRGSILIDLSGNGNNGTLVNGPTYSSSDGGSIVFDATNDYFGGSFVCNKTYYSIDFWCYPTQLTNYNWAIGFNSFWGDFGIHTTSSGGVYVGTSVGSRISPWRNGVYVVNTWQNFTWTFSNGAGKFYKNGVLEASANLALSTNTQFTSYYSGGSGSGNNCTGRLSNFRVYSNKALTPQEIQQNFNATRSRYSI